MMLIPYHFISLMETPCDFYVPPFLAIFKMAATGNKKMSDLWNLCSDLDDLRVVHRVIGCAYVIVDVFQSA